MNPFLVSLRKRSWFVIPLLFTGLFIFIIALRVLAFGVFYIPSSSMERTILPGDIVWGNKLAYGPALPESPYEIPWINLLAWLVEGSRADLERRWWEPKRLRGYTEVRTGDIVVFMHPATEDVMIKRCTGTPGDTIEMSEGNVFINNELYPETGNLLLYSRVMVRSRNEAIEALDSIGINNLHFYPTAYASGDLSIYLALDEIARVKSLPQVLNFEIQKERPDTAWTVYPHYERFRWSIDNFGPLVIPQKSMKIELTYENFMVYGDVINRFECAGLRESNGGIFVGGKPALYYTFTMDYYFMMGDNRHNSHDSRYFGFVPEGRIICKATRILFSRNKNTPRFSRVMKRLY